MKDRLGLHQPAHTVKLVACGFRGWFMFIYAVPIICKLWMKLMDYRIEKWFRQLKRLEIA